MSGRRPDEAGSDEPPPGGGGGSNPGNRNRRNNRKKKSKESSFEGRIPELKEYVYEVSTFKAVGHMFTKTTRELGEYIAPTYKGGGEFVIAFDPDNLGFQNMTEPAPPPRPNDPEDVAQTQIWQTRMDVWRARFKSHIDKVDTRREVSRQAYAVVLGQCSEALRDRLEAAGNWNNVHRNTPRRTGQICRFQARKPNDERGILHQV